MKQREATANIPTQDLYRTRYGRSINLDRIEAALRAADMGSMRQLTDLSRETIDTDPHLASVLNKRFGAISALPWEVQPASGPGIDEARARFYADVVRDQLEQLPLFRQSLRQMAWGLFDGRAALENVWMDLPDAPGIQHTTGLFGRVSMAVKELAWVHPRRLIFGPERELRLWDWDSGGAFQAVGLDLRETRGKYITFMPQLFGDYPEREGLARRCLYWSFFKRFSQRERMMLMELFGKPWRWLEVTEESSASADDLEAADDMLQQLGGSASFRFPRGTKVNMTQPGKGAGEVHQQVIDDSDKQLSKLVLGQTGTTDAAAMGMNSGQANVMQDEQYAMLTQDALLLSEIVETQLTDIIIELNFGSAMLPYAPSFVLRADVPLDRTRELGRLESALKAGLEVSTDEAYKISGFRRPKSDESVVKIDVPPVHPLAVQPDTPRPLIAYPAKATNLPERKIQGIAIVDAPDIVGNAALPPAGTTPAQTGGMAPDVKAREEALVGREPGFTLAPTDVAKVVTVNEARNSQGLPPMTRPDGTHDPDGYLTVAAFDAKQRRAEAAAAINEGVVEPPATTDSVPTPPTAPALEADYEPFLASAHPADALVCREILRLTALRIPCDCGEVHLSGEAAAVTLDNLAPEVLAAEQPSNGAEIGSIEKVVTNGAKEGARISQSMTERYAVACEGLDDGEAIARALEQAAEDMDLHPLARSIERRLMHSAMTGALSGHVDTYAEETTPVATFAATDIPFTSMPYGDALAWFRARNVLPKAQFNQLDAAAKRRSFTVATLVNDRQLNVAKDELMKAMQEGARLRTFTTRLRERFDSAGFTQLNPSHIETVYRTNLVNAYGSGRHRQMSQPAVLKVKPLWRVMGVNDGPPRQRATHAAVSNLCLTANDPAWSRCYPPFGFNCRCKVYPVSKKQAEAMGLRIGSGADLERGLPDPGFTSGTPSLL